MTTWTWTQADVDTLSAAVGSGILTVQYDGPPKRLITYQSISQMEALLGKMVNQVAAAAGRSGFIFIGTSKGLK